MSRTIHTSLLSLRRFLGDARGSVTVETVLVLPFLLWAFLATFTFFDIYRQKTLALKANYAVADLLSRETDPVNQAYINGLGNVFRLLTRNEQPTWLRISVLRCTQSCTLPERTLVLDWSAVSGSAQVLTDSDLMLHFEPVVPVIAEGERLIMVETTTRYVPPFSEGLTRIGTRDLSDLVVTRPRFAPLLLWSDS